MTPSLGDRAARSTPAGAGVGAAIHSVRAVPRDQLAAFRGRAPLHVHLSEQVAENDACLAAYGVTPTRLLHEADLLGPDTTVVHATHLTDDDIELLGTTGTNVCISPTTERDLGRRHRPARAGSRTPGAGSRSAATATRWSTRSRRCAAVEMDERLATQERGHWTAAELLDAATRARQPGLRRRRRDRGRPRADLVTLDTASPRTAGTGADEHTAVFAATAADVVQVVADGRVVYTQGDRERDRARARRARSEALWR